MITQEQYQAILVMARVLTDKFKRRRTLTSDEFKLMVYDALHDTIVKFTEDTK